MRSARRSQRTETRSESERQKGRRAQNSPSPFLCETSHPISSSQPNLPPATTSESPPSIARATFRSSVRSEVDVLDVRVLASQGFRPRCVLRGPPSAFDRRLVPSVRGVCSKSAAEEPGERQEPKARRGRAEAGKRGREERTDVTLHVVLSTEPLRTPLDRTREPLAALGRVAPKMRLEVELSAGAENKSVSFRPRAHRPMESKKDAPLES